MNLNIGQVWERIHNAEWCVLVIDEERINGKIDTLVIWDHEGQWPVGSIKTLTVGYLYDRAVRVA